MHACVHVCVGVWVCRCVGVGACMHSYMHVWICADMCYDLSRAWITMLTSLYKGLYAYICMHVDYSCMHVDYSCMHVDYSCMSL